MNESDTQFRRTVRPPTQAGRFYEADPAALRRDVERYLSENPMAPSEAEVFALMVPHAGYRYSGPVAAAAYGAVGGQPLDHGLILGPSHYGDFTGAVLPSDRAFATPLGNLAVDQQACASLLMKPYFRIDDAAHATEHSLEVQLPFMQVALPQCSTILPVALGQPPHEGLEVLADPLIQLLDARRQAGEHWLIIASTDTYHGYDPAACLENDRRLLELIEPLKAGEVLQKTALHELMACGAVGLALAMLMARHAGARRGQLLRRGDSHNAAHAAGGYVVGYIAAAFV